MPRGRKKTEPASEKIVTEAAESAKIEETAADTIKEDSEKEFINQMERSDLNEYKHWYWKIAWTNRKTRKS